MVKLNYQCDIDYTEEMKYFKEDIVEEILCLPTQKPDMERVLDILVSADVLSYKLIETETAVSNEGQNLSGIKLVVKLKIKEKVTYVANRCTQPVHAAHYEHIKNVFIILPKEIDGENTCKLIKKNKIKVNCFVEAIEYVQVDCRCIHKCVLLLVNAKKIVEEV
ncbi:MAG: hypothetical protein ACRC68_03175 [Clostridium sp.]